MGPDLKIGDRVFIEARVTNIERHNTDPGEDWWAINFETVETRGGKPRVFRIISNDWNVQSTSKIK